jgi:hypothetical protein
VADDEAGVQDHGLLHSLVFGPVATCVEVRAPAAGAWCWGIDSGCSPSS